jgi:hypothetical protein
MNNEPIAWMYEKPNGASKLSFVKEKMLWEDMTETPLYTHPAKYCPSENNAAYEKGFIDGMAKMTESAVHRAVEGMSAKTLTDEEILRIADSIVINDRTLGNFSIDFARAILSKAQEK